MDSTSSIRPRQAGGGYPYPSSSANTPVRVPRKHHTDSSKDDTLGQDDDPSPPKKDTSDTGTGRKAVLKFKRMLGLDGAFDDDSYANVNACSTNDPEKTSDTNKPSSAGAANRMSGQHEPMEDPLQEERVKDIFDSESLADGPDTSEDAGSVQPKFELRPDAKRFHTPPGFKREGPSKRSEESLPNADADTGADAHEEMIDPRPFKFNVFCEEKGEHSRGNPEFNAFQSSLIDKSTHNQHENRDQSLVPLMFKAVWDEGQWFHGYNQNHPSVPENSSSYAYNDQVGPTPAAYQYDEGLSMLLTRSFSLDTEQLHLVNRQLWPDTGPLSGPFQSIHEGNMPVVYEGSPFVDWYDPYQQSHARTVCVDDLTFEAGPSLSDEYAHRPITCTSLYERLPNWNQPLIFSNPNSYHYTASQAQAIDNQDATALYDQPTRYQRDVGRRKPRRETSRRQNNVSGGYQRAPFGKYRKRLDDPELFARVAAGQENKNAIEKVLQGDCVPGTGNRAANVNDDRTPEHAHRNRARENLPFGLSTARPSRYGSPKRARPVGRDFDDPVPPV